MNIIISFNKSTLIQKIKKENYYVTFIYLASESVNSETH